MAHPVQKNGALPAPSTSRDQTLPSSPVSPLPLLFAALDEGRWMDGVTTGPDLDI
ncbi:hypothetical protein BDZ89DRAFT_1069843, partial [Hymenopellis radicata]